MKPASFRTGMMTVTIGRSLGVVLEIVMTILTLNMM
jgi:hypothetical protein